MSKSLQTLPPTQRADAEESPIDQLRDRATELDRQARSFIKQNPTTALVGAVVVGFLIGRMVK